MKKKGLNSYGDFQSLNLDLSGVPVAQSCFIEALWTIVSFHVIFMLYCLSFFDSRPLWNLQTFRAVFYTYPYLKLNNNAQIP
jgi:hypothetical protein